MPRTSRSRRRPAPPVLRRRNYQLLGIGVAAIALGFLLMYMESALDGFISLYVSPLLLMGGYAEIIYALLWRPDGAEEAADAVDEEAAEDPQAA